MNREAQILQALGTANLSEQRALVAELNEIRSTASARVAAARELEMGDEIARAHLTPVRTYARHSSETDWLGKVADTTTTSTQAHTAAKAEASRWFARTSSLVRADGEEFTIQAEGYAQHWAGQFGSKAAEAADSFMQAATHLGGFRRQAATESDPHVILRVINRDRSLAEIQRYLYSGWQAAQVEDGTIFIDGHDDGGGFGLNALRDRLLSGMIGTEIVTNDGAGTKWATRRQAGNPHAVGTPNWFEWEGDPNAEGKGSHSSGAPGGGIPLHGDLTPEQEAWMKKGRPKKGAITDPQHVWTLNPEDPDWIGNFTDDAIASNEAYWDSDQGRASQPYLPGYADAMLKMIRDEKARRTGSRKVAWSIDQARKIVETGSFAKVDGQTLDLFSASALIAVYDKLSPANQAKLSSMGLTQAVDTCFKLINSQKKGSAITAARYGDQRACKFCGGDIEYHGPKEGWIDRGGNHTCSESGHDNSQPAGQKHKPYEASLHQAAEGPGDDGPSDQSQNGYAESGLPQVEVGGATDNSNLGEWIDGDDVFGPDAEPITAARKVATDQTDAVNDYARDKRSLRAGDRVGDSMVTEVGTHTVQFVDDRGWTSAIQIPFTDGYGNMLPSWNRALAEHGLTPDDVRIGSRHQADGDKVTITYNDESLDNSRPAGASPMVDTSATDDSNIGWIERDDDTDMFAPDPED